MGESYIVVSARFYISEFINNNKGYIITQDRIKAEYGTTRKELFDK